MEYTRSDEGSIDRICRSVKYTRSEEEDDVSTEPPEELGEIVELPSLGASYESSESSGDFVFVESVVDGWCYPPPWLHSGEDQCGYFAEPDQSIFSTSFEALLWQH